jgi:hypothetical protein
VKRVVAADAQGGLTLGEPLMIDTDTDIDIDSTSESDINADAGNDHSVEDDEENEETSTCIICLEPFRIGDTVAWSRQSTTSFRADKADKTKAKADCTGTEQPTCLHVFHHDCIVPWLINPKHDDCPACRSVILQDSHGPNLSHYGPITTTTCYRQPYYESSLIKDDDDDEVEDEEKDLEAAPNSNSDSNSDSLPYVILRGLVSRVEH